MFFTIVLSSRDEALLERIKNFFDVGTITKHRAQSIQFSVFSIKDLAKIIYHFEKYPLITQKRADYEFFKQIFYLIERREHLTFEGLKKIVDIKASMNLGLSEKFKEAFPASTVVPVDRPVI